MDLDKVEEIIVGRVENEIDKVFEKIVTEVIKSGVEPSEMEGLIETIIEASITKLLKRYWFATKATRADKLERIDGMVETARTTIGDIK